MEAILKVNIARVPQPIRTRVRMIIGNSQSETIIYNRATMLGVQNKESCTDSQTDYLYGRGLVWMRAQARFLRTVEIFGNLEGC